MRGAWRWRALLWCASTTPEVCHVVTEALEHSLIELEVHVDVRVLV